jgi:glycosyltransferase involved in cell wall biosynthesis
MPTLKHQTRFLIHFLLLTFEAMKTAKPNITVFYPVYNDERTVESLTIKTLAVLKEIADQYEVIIIDDGSPDRSGEIADKLAAEIAEVRVIHHGVNKGYGAAIRTGFTHATFEWVCFTDGDDEYDIYDLKRLIKLRNFYDLIITFRYVKLYSNLRIFISAVYNKLLRLIFRSPYRDISTGLRLMRKSVYEELTLISTSPFIGAEITLRTMLKGYRVGEMGIQTFPREIGSGSSTSMKNILKTIKDMRKVQRDIFSPYYDLPKDRSRA